MEDCSRKIVIGAIMKDEAPYIVEWVAYHRMLGFDLIIADNGGLDETSSILKSLHHLGYITRLDFRHYKSSPQIPAYRAIVRIARKRKIDIVGFLDADEFFTRHYPLVDLSPQNGASYIYHRFRNEGLSQLSFRWLCYGSRTENHDINIPVLQRFNWHAAENHPININVKSFVCIKALSNIFQNLRYLGPPVFGVHCFEAAGRMWKVDQTQTTRSDLYRMPISHETGMVMHHQVKSWEEYQRKIKRGDAAFDNNKNGMEYFKNNDFNDEETKIDAAVLLRLVNEINRIKEEIDSSNRQSHADSSISRLRLKYLAMGISKLEDQKKFF